MGGGDIKMMAMVGAFLGWKAVILTTFLGSLFGAIIGVGLMIFMGKREGLADTVRAVSCPGGDYLPLLRSGNTDMVSLLMRKLCYTR